MSSAGPHQVYTGPNTRVVTNAASATSTCRRWQSRCQVARNGYGDGSISSQPAARFCLRQKGAFDAVQQPLCRYHRRFASPAGEACIRINDDRYSLHPRTKQFVNDFCCLVRLFRAKHVCRGNVVVAARQRCWPLCASRTRPAFCLSLPTEQGLGAPSTKFFLETSSRRESSCSCQQLRLMCMSRTANVVTSPHRCV